MKILLTNSQGLKLKISMMGLMLIVFLNANAQQDPVYSQYMYTGTAINPAVAGSAETMTATAIFRTQWVGIEGAPTTQALNIDAPVMHDKIGLGLSLVNDKIGVMNNMNINAQYAYRLQFSGGTLSMGLQAGISTYKADYKSVVTNSGNVGDNSFDQNISRGMFNFGSGLYYYSERFYAGFSVPHIINQKFTDEGDPSNIIAKLYRHYYLTSGYVFDAGEKVKIKPSTMLKVASGAPIQIDVNTNFWYDETYSLGFSYRSSDSFSLLMQINIAKQLRVGYAYDVLVSKLSRYSSGNHEFLLRYDLPKNNNRIITPRFF